MLLFVIISISIVSNDYIHRLRVNKYRFINNPHRLRRFDHYLPLIHSNLPIVPTLPYPGNYICIYIIVDIVVGIGVVIYEGLIL